MRKFIFPRAVKTAFSIRTAERSLSLEEYTITGSNLPVVNVLPMTIIVWHMHWIHLFKTTNELCTLIVQYAFNLVSIFWRKLMYPCAHIMHDAWLLRQLLYDVRVGMPCVHFLGLWMHDLCLASYLCLLYICKPASILCFLLFLITHYRPASVS